MLDAAEQRGLARRRAGRADRARRRSALKTALQAQAHALDGDAGQADRRASRRELTAPLARHAPGHPRRSPPPRPRPTATATPTPEPDAGAVRGALRRDARRAASTGSGATCPATATCTAGRTTSSARFPAVARLPERAGTIVADRRRRADRPGRRLRPSLPDRLEPRPAGRLGHDRVAGRRSPTRCRPTASTSRSARCGSRSRPAGRRARLRRRARQAARHGRRRLRHAAAGLQRTSPCSTLDFAGIAPVTDRRRQALGARAGEDRRRHAPDRRRRLRPGSRVGRVHDRASQPPDDPRAGVRGCRARARFAAAARGGARAAARAQADGLARRSPSRPAPSRASTRAASPCATTGKAARSGRRVTLPLAARSTPRRCAPPGRCGCAHKRRAASRSARPRLELGANPRVTALLGGRRSTLLTLAVAPIAPPPA